MSCFWGERLVTSAPTDLPAATKNKAVGFGERKMNGLIMKMNGLIMGLGVVFCQAVWGQTNEDIIRVVEADPGHIIGISLEEKNVETVTRIVRDYHETHSYIGTETGAGQNIFVCGDMACDVWNMVVTKGMAARIVAGNVDAEMRTLAEVNHAWVLAGVAPGKWLALETTGGYVVGRNENARYYHGYLFANPKEFKDYYTLVQELQEALAKERWTEAEEAARRMKALLLRNKMVED